MSDAKTSAATVTDAGYPSPGRAWWSIAVLVILSSLSLLDRQIMVLLVPSIRADLGLTDFDMGMLQGMAFSVFYVTFGLLFGWLIDRTSRRAVIFVGVSVWSLATAGCGLAANAVQLMLARFGVGAGEAALFPAGYSIISDTFPKHRLALAMSTFGIGGNIGVGLSLLIGGYLIAAIPPEGLMVPLLGQTEAWRIVFLLAGLPGLAIGLLIWTMAEPARRGRLTVATSSMSETVRFLAARWRFYIFHFMGFALLTGAGYGFHGWAAVFLMRKFELPVAQVVNILAPVAVIGGMAGTLFAGWLVDKLFARGVKDAHLRVFIFSTLAMPVFLALAVSSTNLTGFVVWAMLASAMLGYAGVAPAALQMVTPNNLRGRVSAGFQFCIALIGTGLGPTAVGALTTFLFKDDLMVGWAITLNAAVVCPLAALFFFIALKPMRRANEQAEAWA